MAAKNTNICIITVMGHDQVGIIADLAQAMSKANVNIVDVNQRIMEHFFVMTMAVDISAANVNMETLNSRVDRIAKKLKLNITLQNERIFEAIHRI